nr:alpha/beta fold hydrolase [Comamonas thiooxydans]
MQALNTWFWRCVVMGSWLALLLWCSYWWPRSVAVALLGAGLIASGAGLQLGTQMLMMRAVLRGRGLQLPPAMVALRAWFAEWRWAWRLFGWQIPFGEHAEPDGVPVDREGKLVLGQVGVVLVHGYFCNRGVWTVWLRRLKARGIPCMAVTLEPAHGSPVDAMVDDLDRCVKAMVQQTGRAPLLVAHSMGGLVVRAWLKRLDAGERARFAAHVVTVATPHGGAWLARFAQRLPAVEMREGSDWLQRLGPPPQDVSFSCWCSSSDNIVFPPDLAILPNAQCHQVDDAAHMQLLFDPRVWLHCLQLQAQLQARPQERSQERYQAAEVGASAADAGARACGS